MSSGDQEPRHGFNVSASSGPRSHTAAIKMEARVAISSESLTGKYELLKLYGCTSPFLADCWTDGSLFLAGCLPEANLSSLPCESSLFACFIKASKGDSATKTKVRTF